VSGLVEVSGLEKKVSGVSVQVSGKGEEIAYPLMKPRQNCTV
jgi:hypothetical protein